MGQHYSHISAGERNFIQRHLNLGRSRRWIAAELGRPVSAVSREVRRGFEASGSYDAVSAASGALARRRRGPVKLTQGSPLLAHVLGQIRKGWSPQQIAAKVRKAPPDSPPDSAKPALGPVSHETIYRTIYLMPKGQLRKDIIGLLRQSRKLRRPRSQGRDRRGGLVGMVPVHQRPESVLAREMFGDWEGDLIKGAGNASAVGTLVERKSRYVLLVKMNNCGADAALAGFERALNRVPAFVRTSLAYDQGKDMARHAELASR